MMLDIDDNQKHPYIDVIAQYHWNNDMPFIYTNRKGKLIQQWADGSIDYLVDEETEHRFDKRYEEPFEDDGAYAD
jgi:hypothetical protein